MGLSNVRMKPVCWCVRNSERKNGNLWERVYVWQSVSACREGVSGSKGSGNTVDTLLGMPEARWHWSSRALSISLLDRGNWIVHKNGNWAVLFTCAQADTRLQMNSSQNKCTRTWMCTNEVCSLTKSMCTSIQFIKIMAITTSNSSGKPIVLLEHKCTYTNTSSISGSSLLSRQRNTSNRCRANKQRQLGGRGYRVKEVKPFPD